MRHVVAIIVFVGWTCEAFADGRCRSCGKHARDRTQRSRFADLRWRLTPGQVFYQATEAETRQKMKVLGSDLAQLQKQRTVLRWQFDDWDDDGNALLRCRIVDLKLDIDIGGSRITQKSSPLDELAKSLIGVELRVAVEHDGKVGKTRVIAAEFDKLRQKQPQREPLGKNLLGGLPELARLVFSSTPNRIVRINESWRHDSTSSLPDTPALSLQFKDRLNYSGRDKKLHRIELKGSSHYQGGLRALGVKLLKPPPEGKRRGTIWFDPVKHRLDSLKITSTLSGTMELDIGGQATSVGIDQEQTTRVRVSDQPPPKQ